MPLSEEELRLLEQMERALVEEDPKFASTLRGTSLRRSARRRAIVSGIAFVGGMALLVTGVGAQSTIVGIVGFVVMLASATVCATAIRSQQNVAESPGASHPARGGFTVIDGGRRPRSRGIGRFRRPAGRSSRHSFMERMEERWRRRRDDGW